MALDLLSDFVDSDQDESPFIDVKAIEGTKWGTKIHRDCPYVVEVRTDNKTSDEEIIKSFVKVSSGEREWWPELQRKHGGMPNYDLVCHYVYGTADRTPPCRVFGGAQLLLYGTRNVSLPKYRFRIVRIDPHSNASYGSSNSWECFSNTKFFCRKQSMNTSDVPSFTIQSTTPSIDVSTSSMIDEIEGHLLCRIDAQPNRGQIGSNNVPQNRSDVNDHSAILCVACISCVFVLILTVIVIALCRKLRSGARNDKTAASRSRSCESVAIPAVRGLEALRNALDRQPRFGFDREDATVGEEASIQPMSEWKSNKMTARSEEGGNSNEETRALC